MGSPNGKPPDEAAAPSGDGGATPSATGRAAAGSRPATSHGKSFIRAHSLLGHDDDDARPPLPPRSSVAMQPAERPVRPRSSTLQLPRRTSRPQLLSGATTALSLTDIQIHSNNEGARQTYAQSLRSSPSHKSLRSASPAGKLRGYQDSDAGDTASILSSLPRGGAGTDVESILGDVLVTDHSSGVGGTDALSQKELLEMVPFDMSEPTADFNREFDELEDMASDGSNEEQLLEKWRSKRKHFLILSAAGKPIYIRHGSDSLVSGHIGVIQTFISFFEGAEDQLKGFSAGPARLVILSRNPLYLVAISKLGESDSQLRVQLEALYMQILSTLTLPILSNIFSKKPSTDLRRPLQGTETLLSALADSFTRGSPSTLLSSLECLRLKHRHRQAINNIMLQARSKNLLYGLIVAGGRLVSVVRPRTHSLHPGDLQLIFNMLFEAGGVKASEGENWIPMCLPGFNKTGFLHMYVSFVDILDEAERARARLDRTGTVDRVAVLLISASKEGFYELREMRDAVVAELERQGQMAAIKGAVLAGRPAATDVAPGTPLQHFLYKSRGHLQYVMPAFEPAFGTLLARRRLLSLYHGLHASLHAKPTHVKVHHCVSREFSVLAWASHGFELYCVAGPTATRNALAQSAHKIVQWARQEEERIFIIGGAVF